MGYRHVQRPWGLAVELEPWGTRMWAVSVEGLRRPVPWGPEKEAYWMGCEGQGAGMKHRSAGCDGCRARRVFECVLGERSGLGAACGTGSVRRPSWRGVSGARVKSSRAGRGEEAVWSGCSQGWELLGGGVSPGAQNAVGSGVVGAAGYH